MKKIALSAAIVTAMAASTAGAATLTIGANSYFTMGGGTTVSAPGFDGQFITNLNGIVLGTLQTATGSHAGAPNGTENDNIDNAWRFFNNTGMHSTEGTAPSVISGSGNTATLDFSGWRVAWNAVESPGINMGGGAWNGNANGVAEVTCGVDCTDGDTFSLMYSATVPNDGTTNFGDVAYLLVINGTITGGDLFTSGGEVPVPAAAWLLGSGLVGLVGVARRRKAVA